MSDIVKEITSLKKEISKLYNRVERLAIRVESTYVLEIISSKTSMERIGTFFREHQEEEFSPTEVAVMLGIKKSTAASAILRYQTQGLLERSRFGKYKSIYNKSQRSAK